MNEEKLYYFLENQEYKVSAVTIIIQCSPRIFIETSKIRGKRGGGIQIQKEEIKSFLFTDGMKLYFKASKKSFRKQFGPINTFRKVARYK